MLLEDKRKMIKGEGQQEDNYTLLENKRKMNKGE